MPEIIRGDETNGTRKSEELFITETSQIIDRSLIFDRWESLGPIVLDLGCGPNKKHENWIGIDQTNYKGVDLQGDVFEVLGKIKTGSVDHVYSSHFFEHIDDIFPLVKEIQRVLKVGGTLNVITPHFSNPYFYSDYTHKTFFGLYTFSYFTKENFFQRKTPLYHDFAEKLRLDDVKLVFKTTRPFYGRYAIKRVFNYLFNSSRYMQEFYEENLSSIFNCYELQFSITKDQA